MYANKASRVEEDVVLLPELIEQILCFAANNPNSILNHSLVCKSWSQHFESSFRALFLSRWKVQPISYPSQAYEARLRVEAEWRSTACRKNIIYGPKYPHMIETVQNARDFTVEKIAFNEEGTVLAMFSKNDTNLYIYQIDDIYHNLYRVYENYFPENCTCRTMAPRIITDSLVVGYSTDTERVIQVISISKQGLYFEWESSNSPTNHLTITNNNSHICVVAGKKSISLHHFETGKVLFYRTCNLTIMSVHLGSQLDVIYYNGDLRQWDGQNMILKAHL